MARTSGKWSYEMNYETLGRLTGKSRNALEQDFTRGMFSKDDLESIFVYLCRYAKIDIRQRGFLFAFSTNELPERPGERGYRKTAGEAKRAAKKAAKTKPGRKANKKA